MRPNPVKILGDPDSDDEVTLLAERGTLHGLVGLSSNIAKHEAR